MIQLKVFTSDVTSLGGTDYTRNLFNFLKNLLKISEMKDIARGDQMTISSNLVHLHWQKCG